MKYVKKYAGLRYDTSVAAEVEQAAARLEALVQTLSLNDLSLSEYGQKYYAYDLRKLTFILQGYAYIILTAAGKLGKNYKDIAIIDHGGGIGLFSFFCKLLGIRTVIYNDFNPVVRADAERIACKLGLTIDHYTVGDAPELVAYIKKNGLTPRVLASRNVIEHVYDIDLFLKTIASIPSPELTIILSTTANVRNPMVSVYTRKAHKRYELVGSPVVWGSKKTIPGTACVDVRKKIIKEEFPTLNEKEYTQLAKQTRGSNVADILINTAVYISTGKLPVEIADPTNTCDPYTGSWVEHLVPLADYKQMAEKNGLSFEYSCGFYSTTYPQKLLNLVTPVLNLFIRMFGKRGLFLAPFMSLVLEKKKKEDL
jgi:hypothetical protein